MDDFREHWDAVRNRLSEAESLCVLSDFDGTLTPIQDHPDQVTLPPPTRQLLETLARAPRTSVGLVSGRALSDLVARARIRSIWYAGNHGFEVMSPSGRLRWFYDPEDVRTMGGLHEEAIRELGRFEGVEIENKGPVLTVHLRRVPSPLHQDVRECFISLVDRCTRKLSLYDGNRVIEARVRNCHKGAAVRFIREHLQVDPLIIYFGDDVTDRDAFREIGSGGVTVGVGPAAEGAQYSLPDVESVSEVLKRLSKELGEVGTVVTDP